MSFLSLCTLRKGIFVSKKFCVQTGILVDSKQVHILSLKKVYDIISMSSFLVDNKYYSAWEFHEMPVIAVLFFPENCPLMKSCDWLFWRLSPLFWRVSPFEPFVFTTHLAYPTQFPIVLRHTSCPPPHPPRYLCRLPSHTTWVPEPSCPKISHTPHQRSFLSAAHVYDPVFSDADDFASYSASRVWRSLQELQLHHHRWNHIKVIRVFVGHSMASTMRSIYFFRKRKSVRQSWSLRVSKTTLNLLLFI